MEAMKLNDQERRVYTGLFNRFDVENSGKLSIRSVGELFASTGLSFELLQQIVDLSGAKRLGFYGKVQFFIALKLIAAAQSGLPLTLESLTAASELPLPIFNRNTEHESRQYQLQQQQQQQQRLAHGSYTAVDTRDQIATAPEQRPAPLSPPQSQMTQPLPPPPTVQRRASRSNPTVDIRSAHKMAARGDDSFNDPSSPPMSPQQYGVAVPQSPSFAASAHNQPPQFTQFVSPLPVHGQSHPYAINPAVAVQPYGKDVALYTAPMIYGPVSIPPQQQQPQAVAMVMAPIAQQQQHVLPQQQQSVSGHMGQQALQHQPQSAVSGSTGGPHLTHTISLNTQQQQQQQAIAGKSLWHATTLHGDGMHSPQSEKSWAMFDDDNQGLISLERKEGNHFASDSKADTSSVSSEAESVDDVWTINDEQRDYYVNQFLKLQSDLQGMVSGLIAKEFFEKSRLPIAELSKIWALADINQDGALTLDEFCIAMHLVVLRRNSIDLPTRLPRSLMPYDRMPPDDDSHGGTLKRTPSPNQSEQQWSATFTAVESRSASSSISTSPGSKPTPANFEFRPIVADPERKIVQPMPVRISPDHLHNQTQSDAESMGVEDLDDVGSRRLRHLALDQVSVHSEQLIDFESDVALPGAHASQHGGEAGSGQSQASHGLIPNTEAIRPVTLPGLSRWNGSMKEPTDTMALLPSSSKQSVSTASSEVYMAPLDRSKVIYDSITKSKTSITSEDNSDIISLGPSYVRPNDKKSLKQAIRKQKEKNMMLSRLNGELNQELQELMEQRIALEIQLEHLRPFYS